jgi:sarcosine oxidase / L-pipecolate oxidase
MQGWAKAAEATYRVAMAAQHAGAIFHCAPENEVISLIYNEDGTKVTGVKTRADYIVHADKVVLCTGAWTNYLVETEGQLRPRGHCLGYIRLTPDEQARYAKMPVVDTIKDDVYFFPPFEDGTMKFAAWTADFYPDDYIRQHHSFPMDDIPKKIEDQIRGGMREIVPSLAERKLFNERICWDADTADSHFLISAHGKVNGLYFGTGGPSVPFLTNDRFWTWF